MVNYLRLPRKPRVRRREIGPNRGNVRGKAAEDRFFSLCSDAQEMGQFPLWLIRVRKATEQEDKEQETDFVALTDRGELRIQIKASEFRALEFTHMNPKSGILCLSVADSVATDEIWRATLDGLTRMYNNIVGRE